MPSTAKSPLLTIEAVVLLVLGVAALIAPFMAGLAITFLIGWVLIVSGAVGLVAAMGGHLHFHRGWSLASAIIALLAGLLLLLFPLIGVITAAIVIGAYLAVDGVSLIALALTRRRRGFSGWPWLLASGGLDLVLALFILSLGAAGSAILLGVVLGVDLIAAGLVLLFQRHGSPARVSAEVATGSPETML
jgi:uncharacterized membrane protein HdeD (DUF308 family)